MELVIETLDDVLPYIPKDIGIIHSNHNSYSVINYVFTVDNTFDTAIARECRGLKFDANGNLIARPFHKFFNLGEKQLPEQEPWHMQHLVLDKLDGSMVHPAMVDGEMVFMTRMGISKQSQQAMGIANPEVIALCHEMIVAGYTPIFEFTSPDNRIVVAYEKLELTLLAVRHMRTGIYMPHDELVKIATKYSAPTVATFGSVEVVSDFWLQARALQDVEGYVIAFENGHRVKVKGDAYALRHKALAGLEHEKHLLAWVATNAVDDIVPLLSPEASEIVLDYQKQVMASVNAWEEKITDFVQHNKHLSRKDFALKAKDEINPRLHSVAFGALDGLPARKGLMQFLERASGTDSKVEAVRPLFGMRWKPLVIDE